MKKARFTIAKLTNILGYSVETFHTFATTAMPVDKLRQNLLPRLRSCLNLFQFTFYDSFRLKTRFFSVMMEPHHSFKQTNFHLENLS